MRFCKGCLIREIDSDEQYQNMFKYIEGLDEEIKTHPAVYEVRLRTCKACSSLVNEMCKHCGCFVEMRTAITRNRCPNKKC